MPARTGPALAVVAVGGAVGALARHGAGLVLPAAPGAIPLSTFLVNVTGCLLIGALIGLLTDRHPLARPFLATGVLGGYTTFSTYAVDVLTLARTGHAAVALAYLAGTLVAALGATWLGARVTRALGARR